MNVKRMMSIGLYIVFVFFQMDFTKGFLFNKKNRDITNAIITASFSPLFDKWIKELTESPDPPVTNILEVVEYPKEGIDKVGEYYLPERELIHKLPTPFSLKNIIYKLESTPRTQSSSHLSQPPYPPIPKIIESVKETSLMVDFTDNSYQPSPNTLSEIISTNDPPIYDPPIYDIISSVKESHLKPYIEPFTNNEILYYIIKKDPTLISNNVFSLKLNNYEGIFLVTGEVVIIILLFSILSELQKFSLIQRKNLENRP